MENVSLCIQESKSFKCKFCDKCFNHASSLSKHKKNCLLNNTSIQQEQHQVEPIANIDYETKFNQLYDMIMKQNKEIENLKTTVTEQNKTIMNLQTTIINMSSKVENSILVEAKQVKPKEEKFNLEKYLNVDCENAINIEEFIQEQFSPDLLDLEKYISNSPRIAQALAFTKCLNSVQQINRPIQVTDYTRNHFKIKHNNQWIDSQDGKWINSKGEEKELFENVARLISDKICSAFRAIKKQKKQNAEQEGDRALEHFYDKFDKISVGVYDGFYQNTKDCENFIHQIIKNCRIEK